MNKKIRKGDMVKVIAGNEKGLVGKVLARNGDKVIVQGLNICKKHIKRSEQNPKGGQIEFEKPIHISNLMVCVDDKPVKLKVRVNENKERELYYLSDGEPVLYRPIKKPK